MNIGDKFSFNDFLAYLFPGMANISGIYVLFLLTPFGKNLTLPQGDLVNLVVFVSISYICGILFAGISGSILRFIEKIQHFNNPKDFIPFHDFKSEIITAFTEVFGVDKKRATNWSEDHFFVCRAIVTELMPNMAQIVSRQNGLLQLRTNLVFPIILWTIVGVSWGIQIRVSFPTAGLFLIIFAIISGLILFTSNLNRKHANNIREVRETMASFLSGYGSGKFKKN